MQENIPEEINIQVDTKATLTCPECEKTFKAEMHVEAKQHFFKCPNEECGADIATTEGECCVFCSHSDKLCPAKQINPNEDEDAKEHPQSLI